MSMLLRPTTTGAMIEIGVGINDDSVQPPDYRMSNPQMYGSADQWRDVTDIWWTRTKVPGSQSGLNSTGAGILDSVTQQWEWNFPPTGGNRRRKLISGTVLNANSAPVAGATVNLYNTATGLLVDTVTSAGDGSYTLSDPNNVACFVVAYLPGSPDTLGTTVNTLTGT